MATQTWPASLPDKLSVKGSDWGPGGEVIAVLSGNIAPLQHRARTLSNFAPVTGTLFLTETQMGTLETFFITTTSVGIDEFTGLEDPNTQLATAIMQFLDRPSYTPIGSTRYRAILRLMVIA